jgi:hypothetical protein
MVKTMFRRTYFGVAAIVTLVCISCDKVPLLAPTNSTVTIDAGSRVVATGGTTEVTATVIESGGTPVQNGTLVRFTTTLGRLDPAEVQTRNGIAVTTFVAGNDSGIAEVKATSGGAGGSSTTTPGTGDTPGTSSPTNSNIVLIAVGSGAVDTITVRANPATVSTNGGTVNVIATVLAAGGRTLPGIIVSFSSNRGTFSSITAPTDSAGEARVTLTTNGDTDITAAAGSKTATAKVTGAPGPSVSLTCNVGSTSGCATATVGQTITFTGQRASGSANLVSAVLDFGDNSSTNLGTLASATNVAHSYAQTGTYTARLTGRDANGETSEASQIVQIVSGASVSVTATATGSMGVSATVTVSGATATQFAWTFEGTAPNKVTTDPTTTYTYTSTGPKTISVTVTLSDGRNITVSTTVNVT